MRQFRRVRAYLIGALIGALLMLSGAAIAQSLAPVQLKHYGCYYNPTGTQRDQTQFHYLPDGTRNCGQFWTKIDWVDD
jgi:hypothetical protein